jgi:hypothetical protein
MAKKILTIKFEDKGIKKIVKRVQKRNDKAVAKTLNSLSKQAVKSTAEELKERTGINIGQVKRRIIVTRATPKKHFFTWESKGGRLGWIKPRKLKGKSGIGRGLSFISKSKRRKKVIEKINNKHSKPFLARVNKREDGTGGNILAFYRKKGNKELIKLVGSTLPTMMSEDWDANALNFIIRKMPSEYRKQLNNTKL